VNAFNFDSKLLKLAKLNNRGIWVNGWLDIAGSSEGRIINWNRLKNECSNIFLQLPTIK
jgi:hypothetical protein